MNEFVTLRVLGDIHLLPLTPRHTDCVLPARKDSSLYQ